MVEERTVEDSLVETVHLVRPNHLNSAGRLFGGTLMSWMDEVAGIVAKRHARCNVITASVDNLRFIEGSYQNDCIVIVGKVTYTGRTSMEVRVDTYKENKTVYAVLLTELIFQWLPLMTMTSLLQYLNLYLRHQSSLQNGSLQRREKKSVYLEKKRDFKQK